MIEQEYIVNKFYEYFSSYNNQNIALYGLGAHTRTILEAFPKFNIKGLLDGYRMNGKMYGKPIIPLDSLLEWNIKTLIIVARAGSVKIIYRRISDFCITNGISVYDMMGNELTKGDKEEEYVNSNFKLCMDDVKQAIREHEIISFDIFNTLLARKVHQLHDIFTLVQTRYTCNKKVDFVKERILAERELAEINPTLEEIYERIKKETGVSAVDVSNLIQNEAEIEREILICRESVKELFDYAKLLDKQVYLISDMYFSKSFIQDILLSHGIEGYRDIFVSCEYHTGKRQKLYQIFKNQVKGISYLHLGDDKEADGTYAKLNGLDSILIDSPSEMLERSSFRVLLGQANTIENNVVLGLLVADLFNSPFCLNYKGNKPIIRSAYQLGHIFIGPILCNFILWLIDKLKRKNYSRILFLTRDGYLMKHLYDEAVSILGLQQKMPESVYFFTSRLAGISATSTTNEHIKYAAELPFAGKPEEFLKMRFFLQEEVIEEYNEKKHGTLVEYILCHAEKIKLRSVELQKNYQCYIKELQIEEGEKLAFFDFVSTGTCQMCVEELLRKKLEGYYFIHLNEEYYRKKQLSVVTYYETEALYAQENNVLENYFFLESIIKSLDSSISHFNNEGKPVYQKESRGEEQIKFIKDVQKGAAEFLKEYLLMLRGTRVPVNKSWANMMLKLMKEKYSLIDISNLDNGVIRDEFYNRDINLNLYMPGRN